MTLYIAFILIIEYWLIIGWELRCFNMYWLGENVHKTSVKYISEHVDQIYLFLEKTKLVLQFVNTEII